VVNSDFCAIAYHSSLIQNDVDNDQIVITIKIGNKRQSVQGIDNIKLFHTGQKLDNPVEIELHDKLTFIGLDKKDIRITDLKPGNRYLFNIIVNTEADGDDKGGNETVSFPIVPSCSCDALTNRDKTGRPTNLKIFQDNGHVMFTFTDNSRCETAFSFTRFTGFPEFVDESAFATSFTDDYSFSALMQCSSDSEVSPGTSSSDDLRMTRLPVGSTYSYCVRAVNEVQYMDWTISDEVRVTTSSAALCNRHTISWEASIDGRITTAPNAGLLPIKNVTVSWQLLSEDGTQNLDCSGCADSTTTNEGGSFSINFNVQHQSLNDKNVADIPVRIKFSNTTNNRKDAIDHVFLCDEGQRVCDAEEGHIFYLKHLLFDSPLHIYDDTSIPFSGKLIIHNTISESSDGCPIEGAEVCPQHKTTLGTLEKLGCGTTDSNGMYNVPVIIGSVIHGVEIIYNSHKFEKSIENKWDYNTGVHIQEGGFYARNDFVDVTKAKMYVQGKHNAVRYIYLSSIHHYY